MRREEKWHRKNTWHKGLGKNDDDDHDDDHDLFRVKDVVVTNDGEKETISFEKGGVTFNINIYANPTATGGSVASGTNSEANSGNFAETGGQIAYHRGQNADYAGQIANEGGQNADDGGQTASKGSQNADEGGQAANKGGQNADEDGVNVDDIKVKIKDTDIL